MDKLDGDLSELLFVLAQIIFTNGTTDDNEESTTIKSPVNKFMTLIQSFSDKLIIDTPLLNYQFSAPKLSGKWFVLSAIHSIGKDRQHETTYILSAIANENFFNTLNSTINEINIQR